MTQNPGYEPGREPADRAEPQYARNGHAHVGQDQRYAQGYRNEGGAAYPPAETYGGERGGYADQGYADQGYDQQGYAQQGGYDDRNYGGGAAYPPAGAAPGRVLTATLQLEDGSGRYYQLREGSNIIGRGQDAQFRLPDTGVSRRHIDIRWDGSVAMLSDLGSTNGTTVNGAPVQDWQLADGDVVRAGHSEILVRIL